MHVPVLETVATLDMALSHRRGHAESGEEAAGSGSRSTFQPVTLTSHGKAFPEAGFLFKSLLPKSTLFNNDFNRVIHSKDHAVLGRIYISNKENLHSCRCPFNFSFSQISRQPWLPVEVQQGRGGAERHLGSHLVQPIK